MPAGSETEGKGDAAGCVLMKESEKQHLASTMFTLLFSV